MYLSDIFTISVNLAGLPGISMPCGFTRRACPIGLQLIGGPSTRSDAASQVGARLRAGTPDIAPIAQAGTS